MKSNKLYSNLSYKEGLIKMITYNTIKEIYSRNFGSMQLFKRNYFDKLVYTEGIMDFQNTLNAFWVVDNVISYIKLYS